MMRTSRSGFSPRSTYAKGPLSPIVELRLERGECRQDAKGKGEGALGPFPVDGVFASYMFTLS